jgi:tRNA(fMet)-specific endonuclease VapC
VSFQAKALRQTEEFLRICAVLVPNEESAHHYGKINAQLHKAGKPIPQNDVWIAAVALEYNLPVATRDRQLRICGGAERLELVSSRTGNPVSGMIPERT